jgi:hypothetical protein
MAIPIEPARWRLDACSEASAGYHASAACYRLVENIDFVAVVDTELKFGQIQRQILFAYLVVAANDATLEQRPERFNRIGMNDATRILPDAGADHFGNFKALPPKGSRR